MVLLNEFESVYRQNEERLADLANAQDMNSSEKKHDCRIVSEPNALRIHSRVHNQDLSGIIGDLHRHLLNHTVVCFPSVLRNSRRSSECVFPLVAIHPTLKADEVLSTLDASSELFFGSKFLSRTEESNGWLQRCHNFETTDGFVPISMILLARFEESIHELFSLSAGGNADSQLSSISDQLINPESSLAEDKEFFSMFSSENSDLSLKVEAIVYTPIKCVWYGARQHGAGFLSLDMLVKESLTRRIRIPNSEQQPNNKAGETDGFNAPESSVAGHKKKKKKPRRRKVSLLRDRYSAMQESLSHT